MSITSLKDLFDRLLEARRPHDVRQILDEIGDFADVEVDQPFGALELQWHPFGDNLSNLSSVGLGTKPGRSLTERVTNAIDAILEARKPAEVAPPESSRLAARQWFGRPISGPDDGLFRWKYAEGDYDRLIHVVLLDSTIDTAPTIDAIDGGIGIRPDDFGQTILSLQRGNKLTKLYLIGAFGQGGAATLAFSEYVLMVSRDKANPRLVGFTLIRVVNLSNLFKEDAYAYLAIQKPDHSITVPSIELEGELHLYEPTDAVKHLPTLSHGSLVRHYGYKLHGVSGALSPTAGNLYHYLHTSMFDPLLPFRIIDLRAGKERAELVTGNRNRLMRLVQKKDEGSEGRTEIRHYRPMEYIVPHGAAAPYLGIEYWVVYAFRKPPKGKGSEQVLRPASNALYVQEGHPILGTLNGQNQGELTAKLLKDISLGMTARHIVIHVDATGAPSRVRRELFSTNREGFKDGDVLRDLMRVLQRMLQEDAELERVERELTDRLTKREAEATNKDVIEQITKLLLDAGLQVKKEGPATGEGEGERQPVPERKRPRYQQQEPLATLPFPQVTKFAIVTPRPTLKVAQSDHEVVLVETDADAEFDRQGRVAIRSEPPVLEQLGKAPLRGGRVRWRLRPSEHAQVGENGIIVASITKPDGTQLQDRIGFEVLPAREEKSKREKGFVPPFNVVPVSPDELELWTSVWPDLGEEAPEEDQAAVAYRPMTAGGEIKVYYSTIFGPFKSMVDKLKQDAPPLATFFETSYAVWVGYHAILQERARTDVPDNLDEEAFERLLEDDRVRVAKMQVKQALQTAQLRHQLLKAQIEVVDSA